MIGTKKVRKGQKKYRKIKRNTKYKPDKISITFYSNCNSEISDSSKSNNSSH